MIDHTRLCHESAPMISGDASCQPRRSDQTPPRAAPDRGAGSPRPKEPLRDDRKEPKPWRPGDRGFTVIEVILALVVFAVLFSFFLSFWRRENSCIRQHKGMVHHDAYTSFIFSGKGVMVPIHHPSEDVEEWICDERRPGDR